MAQDSYIHPIFGEVSVKPAANGSAVFYPKPGALQWTGDDGRIVMTNPEDVHYGLLSSIAQKVWLQGRGWQELKR